MLIDLTLQQELQKLARGRIGFNAPMREHTTIKIGGPADIWFEPSDIDDLIGVVAWADKREVPRFIFGNGSNTLVRDKGIRGLVISLSNFDWIKHKQPTRVACGAGVPLQKLLGWSVENSLGGLEPMTGVPGTIGGAVIMNAGTQDGTISNVVEEVKWITRGKVASVGRDKLEFSYRKLRVPKGVIITEVIFELKQFDRHEIEGRIEKIRQRRKEVQPVLWPSMGSVFKNPEAGPKAWQLIDDCNLRGVRVGGARVSNEHANWIINEGNATAKDVEVLISMIKGQVKEKSDVALETEIVVMGEE